MDYFTITDEAGVEWEFDYQVDMFVPFENQVREVMRYRVKSEKNNRMWHIAPAWVEPPSGFEAYIHGALHRGVYDPAQDNPNGIPPIFDVFSTLRAFIDYLEQGDTRQTARLLAELKSMADYDEPLILLIEGLLADSNTSSNNRLLRYMASGHRSSPHDADEFIVEPYGLAFDAKSHPDWLYDDQGKLRKPSNES